MTRVNRDTICAIVLLVITGVFLVATLNIRSPDYGQLSPRTWPRVILVALAILELIYLVQSIRRKDAPAEADGGESPKSAAKGDADTARPGLAARFAGWRNIILCFVIFLAYLLALPWLGMLVGGMAFVFLLLTALGGWTPRLLLLHALIAILSVGGMWVLFTYGLGVFLPQGELFDPL